MAEESVLGDVFRWCDGDVRLNLVRSGGDWFSVESFAVVVGRVDGGYMRRFSTHFVIWRYWMWRKIMEYYKLTCCHVKLPFLSYFFIVSFFFSFLMKAHNERCVEGRSFWNTQIIMSITWRIGTAYQPFMKKAFFFFF